jgi:hypothetical protein
MLAHLKQSGIIKKDMTELTELVHIAMSQYLLALACNRPLSYIATPKYYD